jgi:hypothetical protein
MREELRNLKLLQRTPPILTVMLEFKLDPEMERTVPPAGNPN